MTTNYEPFGEDWCWVCGDYSGTDVACNDCGDQKCACHAVWFGNDVHLCWDCTGIYFRNEVRVRAYQREMAMRCPGTPGVEVGFEGLTWVSWGRAKVMHLLDAHAPRAVCRAVPGFGWHGQWAKRRCKKCERALKDWVRWRSMPLPGPTLEYPVRIDGICPDPPPPRLRLV